MKNNKIKSALLSFVIVSSTFTGCSSEEKVSINETGMTQDQLVQNLRAYNEANPPLNPNRCDGFWDCLGDVLVVAGADVAAGAAGAAASAEAAAFAGLVSGGTGAIIVVGGSAAIVGGGASVVVYREMDKEAKSTNSIIPGRSNLVIPSQFSGYSQTGIDHNRITYNALAELPISEFYTHKNYTPKQIEIFESPQVLNAQSKLSQFASDYANDFDINNFTADCVGANLLTVAQKDILDVFFSRYYTCTTEGEIISMVNYYMDIVAKSSLSYVEKESLITGFLIAAESPFYWLD